MPPSHLQCPAAEVGSWYSAGCPAVALRSLEERPDRQLLLEGRVPEQRLLVQLELLLGAGRGVRGAEVVRPQVGGAVDERRAQRLCKDSGKTGVTLGTFSPSQSWPL